MPVGLGEECLFGPSLLVLLPDGESEKITFLVVVFLLTFSSPVKAGRLHPFFCLCPSLLSPFVWYRESHSAISSHKDGFYTFVNLHLVKRSLRLCLCVLNGSHKLPLSFLRTASGFIAFEMIKVIFF